MPADVMPGLDVTDMFLELNRVCKRFEGKHLVADEITFSIKEGEIAALLGPSGCGKTTLLRMIAGFETPDSGEILLNGKSVASAGYSLPPEKRNIGMVFQDFALFPHLSVYDNISFGLAGKSTKEKKEIVGALMDTTGLTESCRKFPHELSGGQQQRVALARAIAPQPLLLLLDEPFSSLDVSLRENLSAEVRKILKEFGMTAIMVTHNQQEAFAMADRTGVMMESRILQLDSAEGLYSRPVDSRVANFIGEGCLVEVTESRGRKICCELGDFEEPQRLRDACTTPVQLFVRPEDLSLDPQGTCRGLLEHICFRGPGVLLFFTLPSGRKIKVSAPSAQGLEMGAMYGIRVKENGYMVFS